MPGAGDDSPAPGFGDRLAQAVTARESQIVLGIDPDPARLWPDVREANGEQRERLAIALVDTADAAGTPTPAPASAEAAAAVLVHCRALIDAAGPACVAVKPQLACFERLGSAGWLALEATCEHARAAGLLVLADGKRGDVPVTATAYAQALVGSTPSPFGAAPGLAVDAFTANPLLGRDALIPLVEGARAAAPACSCSSARPTPAPPTCSTSRSPPASRCGSGWRARRRARGGRSRSPMSAP